MRHARALDRYHMARAVELGINLAFPGKDGSPVVHQLDETLNEALPEA